MIITCAQCQSSFNLDESRLQPTGSKVRCSDCRHVFVAYPVQVGDASQPAAALAAGSISAPAGAESDLPLMDGMIDSFLAGEGGTVQARVAAPATLAEPAPTQPEQDFDFDLMSVADEVTVERPQDKPQPEAAALTTAPDEEIALDLDLDLAPEPTPSPAADHPSEQELDFDLDLESGASVGREPAAGQSAKPAEPDEAFDLDEVESLLDLDIVPEAGEPFTAAAVADQGGAVPEAESPAAMDLDLLFDQEERADASTGADADLADLEAALEEQLREGPAGAGSALTGQAAPALEMPELSDIDQVLQDVERMGAGLDLEEGGAEAQPAASVPAEDEDLDLALDFDYDQDDTAMGLEAASPDEVSDELDELEKLLEMESVAAPAQAVTEPAMEDLDVDLEKLLSEIDTAAPAKPEPVPTEEINLAAEIESLIDIEPEAVAPVTLRDEELQFDLGEMIDSTAEEEPQAAKEQWAEPSVDIASVQDDVSEGTYRGEEPEDGLGELELSLSPERAEPQASSIKEYELEGPAPPTGMDAAAGGDMELEFEIEEEGPGTKAAQRPMAAAMAEGPAPDLTNTYTMSALPTETEDVVAAAPIAKKAVRPYKRRRRWPKVLLTLLLVLLFGGVAALVGLEWLGIEVPRLGPAIRQIPFMQKVLPPQAIDPGNMKIRTQAIASRFVESKSAGRLFVISGQVVNDYPQPRSHVLLTAKLYLKNKVLGKSESAFAGNLLSDAELAASDMAAIRKSMKNRNGDKDTNVNLTPGKILPFMVVFNEIPEGLEEYTLEVTSSTSTATSP